MNDIINLLRDDREYYSGVGRDFLSNSDIESLLKNPQDFKKSRPDNKSFAEGRYFHQLILEPEKAEQTPFVDCSSRTTNIYRDFCTENNFEYVLLWKEMVEIRKLVNTMKRNITFYDMIYAGGQFEVPSIGEVCGEAFKGKADIVNNDRLIDLKTTSDILKFKWNAKSYNYDSQAYIYQELFGKPLDFLVIDKVTGQLGVFYPSVDFILGGKRKVESAVAVYRKYFKPGTAEDLVINHFISDIL
jgi:hypothetical protein